MFRHCLLSAMKIAVLLREMTKMKVLGYVVVGLPGGWTKYGMERDRI